MFEMESFDDTCAPAIIPSCEFSEVIKSMSLSERRALREKHFIEWRNKHWGMDLPRLDQSLSKQEKLEQWVDLMHMSGRFYSGYDTHSLVKLEDDIIKNAILKSGFSVWSRRYFSKGYFVAEKYLGDIRFLEALALKRGEGWSSFDMYPLSNNDIINFEREFNSLGRGERGLVRRLRSLPQETNFPRQHEFIREEVYSVYNSLTRKKSKFSTGKVQFDLNKRRTLRLFHSMFKQIPLKGIVEETIQSNRTLQDLFYAEVIDFKQ